MKVVSLSDADASLVAGLLEDFLENAREAAVTDDGVDPQMDADNNRIQGIADMFKTSELARVRDENHWNVLEVFAYWIHHRSYTDFEGFASKGVAARRVQETLEPSTPGRPLTNSAYIEVAPSPEHPYGEFAEVDAKDQTDFIRDVLLHFVYENIDQGDYLPSVDELRGAAWILQYLLQGSLRLLKVTDEQYTEVLNAPDEPEEEGGE